MLEGLSFVFEAETCMPMVESGGWRRARHPSIVLESCDSTDRSDSMLVGRTNVI